MPTINTRITNKHDTEANWSKSNLVPLNGEVIIFEADDNTPYPRFKVGDGETNINNLPFTDSDYVKQDELSNYVTTDNVNQSINNMCVLYTEAQALTEEQKAQARENIGAADASSGGSGNNIANATVTLGAQLTYNGAAITFVSLAEKGDIDEVTATEHADLFELWVTDKDYIVGKIVTRPNGNLYKCVQAHRSQADWEPENTPALWTKIGDPSVEYPEWSQPLGAHDAYAQGAKVSHNGKKWTSDVANNVWEPGVYGWTEVVE